MPDAIELPENCDTPWAVHFHETMVQEVAHAGSVRLRAGGVRRINTPAVQTILALGRSMEDRQGILEIEAPSQAFSLAFADLGLTTPLESWSCATHG
jgi:STAS domain